MAVTFVNGQYVNADEAVLPVNDLAVIRGFGAFDFLRTYGGKPFRLTANIERLRRSCELITLPFPWSNEEISEIVHETLRRNDLPEANIRILVTGGVSPDFFTPTGDSSLLVMVAPLRPLATEIYEKGAKAITVRMDRIVHGAKSINYIPGIIAMNQARGANAIGNGLAAALNIGDGHAVANAGHGSAPDIAGRGIANPAGLTLSAAMLLEWLGVRHAKPAFVEASRALHAAVDRALADPAARTGDLGGRGGTRAFGEAVAREVKAA